MYCFSTISGDFSIIGSHLDDDNGINSGSAYIYYWDGTDWIEHTKLTASDGAAGDVFGYPVSISGDKAIVGAPGNDGYSGSAYVYHLMFSNINVSPLSYNFGEVEIGSVNTFIMAISNSGEVDLEIEDINFGTNSSTDFSIVTTLTFPIILTVDASVDIEFSFTPTVEGLSEAQVNIASNDPDEPVLQINLTGTGVALESPPNEQIQAILDFIDTSIDDGTLAGEGPGNSASNRVNALKNMIEAAYDLYKAGDLDGACAQLEDVHRKVDCEPKPPDFVSGGSREELATMIQDLIESIGFEGGFPKKPARDIYTQSIPKEYKLKQNHPNPFNPLTTINYSLAEACHVKISVYNSIGQLMTVLVDEMKSSGHHRVTWDVSNQGEIASGI